VPQRELADWWTRVGAFLLDQLILGGVGVAALLAARLVGDDPSDDSGRALVYAILLPIAFLYAPLLMARSGPRNGQTIGKQLVGIRVVRVDGAPVSFGTGILRTVIGQQLPAAITFYAYALVDYLWPLRDAQNQALHDKLAKTWVLRMAASEPPRSAWPPPQSPSQPQPPPQPDETPVHDWLPPRAPGV
jgi:uncharacterized RDD family membrane protein YckC